MKIEENFIKLGGLYVDHSWYHVLFTKRLGQDIDPNHNHFSAIAVTEHDFTARRAREFVQRMTSPAFEPMSNSSTNYVKRWDVEILSPGSPILVCDYRLMKYRNEYRIIVKAIANNKVGWMPIGLLYNSGPPLGPEIKMTEISFSLLTKLEE